jgi:hypothetical protein
MVAHAEGCVVINSNGVGVGVKPNKLVLFVGLLFGLQGGQPDGHDLLMKARALPPLEPLSKSELDATANLEGEPGEGPEVHFGLGFVGVVPQLTLGLSFTFPHCLRGAALL